MNKEIFERMLNNLLLNDCGAQHCEMLLFTTRVCSEMTLFSIRMCAFCMLGFVVFLLIGLLRDFLDIVKCCIRAFGEGLATIWNDLCVCLETLCRASLEASAVCVAASKEVWPHCTKDNIVMVSSIFLLLITFPGMANSVGRFLDRMITDTAPLPCATT